MVFAVVKDTETGVKSIIHESKIKKFDRTNYELGKKYNTAEKRVVQILFIADTEEEGRNELAQNRYSRKPLRALYSASETDENSSPNSKEFRNSGNRATVYQQAAEKRTLELRAQLNARKRKSGGWQSVVEEQPGSDEASKIVEISPSHSSQSYSCVIATERCDLQKKCDSLEDECKKMRVIVSEKNKEIESLIKRTGDQFDTIDELKVQLKEKDELLETFNAENERLSLQIENFGARDISSAKRLEVRKTPSDVQPGTVDDLGKIYLGNQRWLEKRCYDLASHGVKTASAFVYNMTLAIFEIDTLATSTITGRRSNNRKKKTADDPKFDVLDPEDILAIKEIFRFFMRENFKCSETEIDALRDKVVIWVGRKAAAVKAELQQPKKNLPGAVTDNGTKETIEGGLGVELEIIEVPNAENVVSSEKNAEVVDALIDDSAHNEQ